MRSTDMRHKPFLILVLLLAPTLSVEEGEWEVDHCILASMDLQLFIQFMDNQNNIITTFPTRETVTGSCDSNTKQEMTVSWKDPIRQEGREDQAQQDGQKDEAGLDGHKDENGLYVQNDGNGLNGQKDENGLYGQKDDDKEDGSTSSLRRNITFRMSNRGSVYGIESITVAYQQEDRTWAKFKYEDQGLFLVTPINRTYSCKDLTAESDSIQFTDYFGITMARQAWIEISRIRINAFRPEPAGGGSYDTQRTAGVFQSRHKCEPEVIPWVVAGLLGGVILAIIVCFVVKVYM